MRLLERRRGGRLISSAPSAVVRVRTRAVEHNLSRGVGAIDGSVQKIKTLRGCGIKSVDVSMRRVIRRERFDAWAQPPKSDGYIFAAIIQCGRYIFDMSSNAWSMWQQKSVSMFCLHFIAHCITAW